MLHKHCKVLAESTAARLVHLTNTILLPQSVVKLWQPRGYVKVRIINVVTRNARQLCSERRSHVCYTIIGVYTARTSIQALYDSKDGPVKLGVTSTFHALSKIPPELRPFSNNTERKGTAKIALSRTQNVMDALWEDVILEIGRRRPKYWVNRTC
jgi:hypothetical protein